MLSVHRVESFHQFCSASATSPPASVLFPTGSASADWSRCADLQRQGETASLRGLYFTGTLLKLKKKRKASYSLLRDRSYAGHYHNCFLKTRQTLPSTEFNIYTEAENNRQERACVTTLHQQNTDSASLIHKIIEQP